MKRTIAVVALAVLTTGVLATPAQAAARPVPVLSTDCTDGFIYPDTVDLAQGADGVVHGFAGFGRSESCGTRLFYFEGEGESWRSTAIPRNGSVVSVAHDDTGTYLLYIADEPGIKPRLVVDKRTPDGRITQLANLASVPADGPDDAKGSIVARDGKWLAVWEQAAYAPGDYDLYRAGTLFNAGAAAGPATSGKPFLPGIPLFTGPAVDRAPSLTLGPDGLVNLAWTRVGAAGSEVLLARSGTGQLWAQRSVAANARISSEFRALDVAVTRAGTFVSWTQLTGLTPNVVVADNLAGAFQIQQPPALYDSQSWDATLVASGTKVAAGYSTGDEYPADQAYVAARTSGTGDWGARSPVTGIDSIDSFGVAGLALTGSALTALVFVGGDLYAVPGLTL